MGNTLSFLGKSYAIVIAALSTFFAAIMFAVGTWTLFQNKGSPKLDNLPPGLKEMDPKESGTTMIFASVMVVMLMWGWVYLTQNSDLAAKLSGGIGIFDIGRAFI